MAVFETEERLFAPRHVLGWTLFTLASGFVNAAAVMACKNFVTHITGNVTNLAVDSARVADYAFVGASFIVGAMIAVLIGETAKSRPKVGFAIPLVVSFVTLIGIAIAGKAGLFGTFGVNDQINERAFIMLGLLAGVMGMVNAALAAATNNKIRVTHLTGPATDLAGNFIRAALGAGMGHAAELRWGMLRTVKLAAFAIGALMAVKLATRLEYDLFAVAGGILIMALGFTGAPESADEAEGERTADEDAERSVAPSSSGWPYDGDAIGGRTSSRDDRPGRPSLVSARRHDNAERDAAE